MCESRYASDSGRSDAISRMPSHSSGTISERSEITMCGGSGQDCIGIPEPGIQMVGEGLSLDWPETRLSLRGRVFWARTNQLAAWREQALHLHRRLSLRSLLVSLIARPGPADTRRLI